LKKSSEAPCFDRVRCDRAGKASNYLTLTLPTDQSRPFDRFPHRIIVGSGWWGRICNPPLCLGTGPELALEAVGIFELLEALAYFIPCL